MPLVHKSSALSLRQRITRRESHSNLQEQNAPEFSSEAPPKWNLAQRLKRRRSAQVLGEKSDTNIPTDAPPVPAIPSSLKSALQHTPNTVSTEQPPVQQQEKAKEQESHNWPLPDSVTDENGSLSQTLVNHANEEIQGQEAQQQQQHKDAAARRARFQRPTTRDGNSGGGLMVKLRQSHQQLRQSFLFHDSPNAQPEPSPGQKAFSPDPSTARPTTSHGKLRSVRSLGHMLSSSSSQNHSASLEPPVPFHPAVTAKSPTASPKRKHQRPNTPPEIPLDHGPGKKSFWSRVKSGFRERKPKEVSSHSSHSTEVLPQSEIPTSVPPSAGMTSLSKKEQAKQAKLSQRVTALEAQLREARAQLEMLKTPEELSEVSENEDEDVQADADMGYDVAPITDEPVATEDGTQTATSHQSSRRGSFAPIDPMEDVIDACEMETDPADDLPVDGPADIPKSKTLSTVIEVASQECTPAQQRTEPPMTTQLKPLNLNSLGGTSDICGGTDDSMAQKRTSRSMSSARRPVPLRLVGNDSDDVFTSAPSRMELAEQVVAAALGAPSGLRGSPAQGFDFESTVAPASQASSGETYFLPSTTYTPERKERAASTLPQPVELPFRQLPIPTSAATARARALVAASALPSTLVQSSRRPVGPVMPIIPSLPNMPARPPPLRRPVSMPSVASAARTAKPSLASLILQEDPREDEEVETRGSNRNSDVSRNTGTDSNNENGSDEESSNARAISRIRALPTVTPARKSRSVLGLLSPSDGNMRSPPTSAHHQANLGGLGPEKKAGELSKGPSAIIKTNDKKGTVSITFPKNTPTTGLIEAAKTKARPRALSSPPETRSQPPSNADPPESPNAKGVFIFSPPSPALSDKENLPTVTDDSQQQPPSQIRIIFGDRTGEPPVILLTAAESQDPEPADGGEDKEEDKQNKGPSCDTSLADLDDPFRNQRFPPSGGSGVAIPVITTTTVSSLSDKLGDEKNTTTDGDRAAQRHEQDSRTKTSIATRALGGGGVARVTGDRSSQLVGAQRQPGEWVWPDDVF